MSHGHVMGFPGSLMVKNLPANVEDARDLGFILGSGRSPREGNGNPLQSSCLGNSTSRGVGWATVHGFTKNWTRQSTQAHTCPSHSFKGCVLPTSLIFQNYPGDLFKLIKNSLFSFLPTQRAADIKGTEVGWTQHPVPHSKRHPYVVISCQHPADRQSFKIHSPVYLWLLHAKNHFNYRIMKASLSSFKSYLSPCKKLRGALFEPPYN